MLGPPKANTFANSSNWKSKLIFPVGYAHRLALECQHLSHATIANLNGSFCPSAIRRLIVAVVVNAVNRVFRGRTQPHVAQEILKQHPSLANGDASSTVVFVSNKFGVGATSTHAHPREMLRAISEPVPSSIVADPFSLPATARFGLACPEQCAYDVPRIPAFATAQPCCFTADVWCSSGDNKPSKSHVGDIDCLAPHAHYSKPNRLNGVTE